MIKRRSLLAAAGAGALGSALATGTARADSTISVDPSTTYGTWEGWGTSLAWWAKVFGSSAEYSDVFADLLFTDKTVTYMGTALPGLNLDIARYNLGACGWNTVQRSSGTVRMDPGRIPWHKQIAGFWLDPGSGTAESSVWNWDADPAQRAMLLKATQRGAISELFANSPMWWMTNSLNPSGATKQYGDNLNDTYRRHHASHLATVALHARENWGVDFVSVEPFNEPKAGNWWTGYAHPQEGCCINTAEQAVVLSLLREELDTRGLATTRISASDDATFEQAIPTWNDLKSNGGSTHLDRVNVHGYGAGSANAGTQRAQLYSSVVQGSGKALWSSENGTADADGFKMAQYLLADLYALHPTAWAYWQPLDTHPDWAMIHFTVNDGQDPAKGVTLSGDVNTKYWVMGQFSRHIRPGMKMLRTGVPHAAAALDESADKLVVVVANNGPLTNMTFDLSAFTTATGGANGVVYRWNTGVGEKYVRRTATVSGKKVTIPINANCVQTLEIQGVVV
ncbi:glycoside hydrolase (plasmid) [Streptomyces sp. HUAS 31]|uniref:glycoside hydrolase n=1 Tax=Streptomyces sp. HUAS 31 TaxID=3020055 RepID=UPI0023061CC1|nr:glycoside hydrolase [Streptomyces sp. HUAS 31]WCE02479.1 glycoside hydrolase [Streptomyces sp. HUAS 31]